MNSKRPIDVGMSSSLIDLKAELLKKQAEANSSKSRQQGAQKSLRKSDLLKAKNVYSHKNSGIEARSKKDLETVKEEEKTIEKSRSILEAKAKLYEKMTSEALEHDEQEHPVLSQALVNFTQKAIDQINESREQQEKGAKERQASINNYIGRERKDEEYESVIKEYDYSVNEDEWTEFTDALGRTRRCLKSDLPSFISRDEELARPLNPQVCLSKEDESSERLIEIKRQKWEQETEEAAAKEKVHYQDVLYDVKIDKTVEYGVPVELIQDFRMLIRQRKAKILLRKKSEMQFTFPVILPAFIINCEEQDSDSLLTLKNMETGRTSRILTKDIEKVSVELYQCVVTLFDNNQMRLKIPCGNRKVTIKLHNTLVDKISLNSPGFEKINQIKFQETMRKQLFKQLYF